MSMSVPAIRDVLRTAVLGAMKERDRVATAAYRGALSAIDNAEAVAVSTAGAEGVVGLGAGETQRRSLSEPEMRDIVRTEARSARRAAGELAAHPEHAARVHREADLLDGLLEAPR